MEERHTIDMELKIYVVWMNRNEKEKQGLLPPLVMTSCKES